MLASLSAIFPKDQSRTNPILAAILVLTAVKLLFAGLLPLAGDESLYWMYSKHLAPGFIDHPPMNPLMIRLGTTLFGDTPFGVRVMAVLMALPATWAVWRAAGLLFRDEALAASAALLFNLTTAMTVGSLAATSDPMVIMASSFLLYFLAKLNDSQHGVWWLAVGVAFGLGMFSKYTTGFFAVSILIWLVFVPANRKWLLTVWPWAGGLIATCIFSPVFLWNANHQWASFNYQANRLIITQLSLRYVFELIGSQLVLATPPIFALGAIGLASGWRGGADTRSARTLIAAMVAPIPIYFLWHALHQRVQGNWPEPVYPAFAIAAALAAHTLISERSVRGFLVRWSKRLAAPFGLAVAAAVFLQASFAIVPLGRSDPSARVLAVGWKKLAQQLDDVRERSNIPAFATLDYTTTGWLTFYLRSGAPVVQLNERIRWVDAPQPAPELLSGPLLYVCKGSCPYVEDLKRSFGVVQRLDTFVRERNGVAISSYTAFRLERPIQPVLDPVYPPMNMGNRDD